MCAGEGKPPGSGQPLPKKQSHSDERLIAIVFFCFPKAGLLFPERGCSVAQAGFGWLLCGSSSRADPGSPKPKVGGSTSCCRRMREAECPPARAVGPSSAARFPSPGKPCRSEPSPPTLYNHCAPSVQPKSPTPALSQRLSSPASPPAAEANLSRIPPTAAPT